MKQYIPMSHKMFEFTLALTAGAGAATYGLFDNHYLAAMFFGGVTAKGFWMLFKDVYVERQSQIRDYSLQPSKKSKNIKS